MRVLVTGAAGFIGSHLVDRLVADGHRVTGLDDLSTGRLANLGDARKAGPPRGLYFHKFDITETELEDVLARERPEVVLHLAALRGPRETGVGVLGTAGLLQACTRTDVQRIVLASDATAVYAPARKPVSERAGVGPSTTFGAAKVAAEHYLETYQRRYALPGVVLRLASVYGPRQRAGVVPSFAAAMVKGRAGTVFGDGSVVRDFVHVDDVVDAFVRCLGGKADGRRLNIGTGEGTSVRALHTALAGVFGVPDAPEYQLPRPGEPPYVVLECSAARRALGWEPATALADGLADLPAR